MSSKNMKNFACFISIIFLIIYSIRLQKIKKDLKAKQERKLHKSSGNYDKPILFLSGAPRSGVNVLKNLLKSNGLATCSEPIPLISNFLFMNHLHIRLEAEAQRLVEAGIDGSVLNGGAKTFVKNLIEKNDEKSLITCYSDLTNAIYADYLAKLFPESKFIMIIRDGRAMVNSINKNNKNNALFPPPLVKSMMNWNDFTEIFLSSCKRIGSLNCLIIFFEQLIINPEREIQKISKFLNVPLKKIIYKLDKDKIETSLNSWIGRIDKYSLSDNRVPMLKKLGYDSKAKITNYTEIYEKLNRNFVSLRKESQYNFMSNITAIKATEFSNDIYNSFAVVSKVVYKNG